MSERLSVRYTGWLEDSDSVFKRIQRDPDVCNNCFRRTHKTFERNYAVDTFVADGDTEASLWARQIDAPSQSFRRPHRVDYVPGTLASDGTHTYCECGYVEPERPVELSTATAHARRLKRRLEEIGAEPTDELLDEVRRRMRKPKNQGRFDSVLDEICSKRFEKSSP